MFYNIEEIEKKAFKIYSSGALFRDFMDEENLFPFSIKLKKIKQSDIQNSFVVLQDELKVLKATNLHLVYKTFQFHSVGQQMLPVEMLFESRDVLLKYIDKQEAFIQFVELYHKTMRTYPTLKGLLFKKPFLFLEQHEVLDKLFLVCQFFIEHPKPNIYLRELSIVGVDTKFVENHKKILDLFLTSILDEVSYQKEIVKLSNDGFEKKYYLKCALPMIRFRILDEKQALCGLLDMSVTIEAFKKMEIKVNNIIIVENKMTLLSFPVLSDTIVIFGGGYGVDILKDALWLHTKKFYYWGDIDSDGFAILSRVRGYFPHVVSLLMDKKTIEVSKVFSECYDQQYKILTHLTKDEENVYTNFACSHRLEQERIPFSHVMQRVKELNHE